MFKSLVWFRWFRVKEVILILLLLVLFKVYNGVSVLIINVGAMVPIFRV